jgi:hypothetical protein
MNWKQVKKWSDARKLQESVQDLSFERFRMKHVFPPGVEGESRLPFVLNYLRSKTWRDPRSSVDTLRSPQGKSLIVKRGKDIGDASYFMGKHLNLPLKALNYDEEGSIYMDFEADPKDNCQDIITLVLDWVQNEVDVTRTREGYVFDPPSDDPNLTQFYGERIVAAWTVRPVHEVVIHTLWTNGKILSMSKVEDEVTLNIEEDLVFVAQDVGESTSLVVSL